MLRLVIAVLTMLVAAIPGHRSWANEAAAAFPSRTVRLIVPYPAGGSNDIVARLMAVKLADRWKQSVIVENRVGASGIVASQFVANSPPDGYAILVGSNSATTIAEHLKLETASFKGLDDLVALTNVLSIPAVLVANPKFPASNLDELVKLLKQNPGKYTYSSSGAQSGYHLSMLQFQTMTGTQLIHVPYAGLAPAERAVIAGETQLMLASSLTGLNHIKGGRMKAIGLASVETWPMAPELPLLSKALPGFQSLSFIGLFAARGTPAELADKITADIRAMLHEEDMRKRLLSMGALPSTIGMSREDFRKFLAEDSDTWGKIIKAGAATSQR